MSDIIGALNLTSFPVLVVDKNGIVTGKNAAAKSSMNGLRVGTSVFGKAIVRENNMLFFDNQPIFKKGILVTIGKWCERKLVLFPMVLQHGDGTDNAEKLAGLDPNSIFDGIEDSEKSGCDRLYKTLTDIFVYSTNAVMGSSNPCDVYDVSTRFSSKISGGAGLLGKRGKVEISDDVQRIKIFSIDERVFDDVLALGTYASLMRSEKGTVEIYVGCDEKAGEVIVRFTTRLAPEMANLRGMFNMSKIFPECAAELYIAKALGAPDMNCIISDLMMRIEVHLSYLKDRSVSLSEFFPSFTDYFEIIFLGLEESLGKDPDGES